jgi:hypothetical protein
VAVIPNRKGAPRKGGRSVGTQNAVTVECKQAIELAFLGLGGVPALTNWARKNRGLFYTKLWARLLPREIQAQVSADVTVRTDVRAALIDSLVAMLETDRQAKREAIAADRAPALDPPAAERLGRAGAADTDAERESATQAASAATASLVRTG